MSIENTESFVTVMAEGSRVANGTLAVGTTREFTATNQFCVRTDSANAVHLVLDGLDLGTLDSGSWIIKSGLAPVRAARPC